MPSRPKCQRCFHRPGRRIGCPACLLRLCPGCYGDETRPVCQDCDVPPEPDPEPSPVTNSDIVISCTPLLHGPTSSFWPLSQEHYDIYDFFSSSSSSSAILINFSGTTSSSPLSSLCSASLFSSTSSSATSHRGQVLSSPIRRKRLKKDFWECLFYSSH